MKNLFTFSLMVFLSIFSFSAFATTYYLSSSSGNDNNSGTDPSSPWRTIDKLNSFYNLRPGDNVLFKRGDTFYGGIIVNNSGSSGNPITYGAYGSGNKPIITGFTNVTSWNNLGGNIWESTDAVSSLPYTNMVSVNGINTAMGRYPNSGYLTYQSINNSSLVSNSLSGSSNWSGADVLIKKNRYTYEIGHVTSQSGGTLNFTCRNLESGIAGFGFFIQNDIRTLDTQNEWYYNPNTKKLSVYNTSTPTNFQIATVESLLTFASRVSNISVIDISFVGSNSNALNLNNNNNNNNNNITIKNCAISFAGIDGISIGGSNADIENNTLSDINNTALDLAYSCSNSSVINNTINNTGLIPGMTQTWSIGTIYCEGPNSLIQYNNIDNSGYSGIRFFGANTKVKNNFINHSCLIKDDGAGIYTWGTNTGREISGNIVINSMGAPDGTDQTSNYLAHGIHLDGGTRFVTVSENTVSGCSGAGLFIQQSTDIVITGNTSYNNGIKGNWLKGAVMFQYTNNAPIRNITMDDNIFFAKTLDQDALFYYTSSTNQNDLLQFGTADNNYYARPLNGDNTILTQTGSNSNSYNITSWKSYIGQDGNSNGSPKSINSIDSLRFEYNASTSSKTVPLDAQYIDVKGNSYNGSITLAPYTSAVLIKNGPSKATQALTSWTAQAGPDQTITLPVNTASLTASSSDPTTYINTYVWTKTSGPAGGEISNKALKTVTITGLVEGVYNYEVQITDKNGVVSTASVKVTVNPPQSTWSANAGPDQIVTLPTNSATLTGSSTDPTTYINTYVWTKISGPTGGEISNKALKTVTITGLVEGVYNYQLEITDKNGIVSTTNVKVTVNAAQNSWTAIAGPDQTITLPVNSTTLSGRSSDPMTYINTYVWTKISGPSGGEVKQYWLKSITLTGLIEGVYTYQLAITDNKGAVSTTSVKVTVNAAQNLWSANAGPDQTIILPVNNTTLTGSTNKDPYIYINTYVWKKVSGPSGGEVKQYWLKNITLNDLVPGVYVYELDITDNKGAFSTANVKVTVKNSENSWIAIAGPDQTLTLPVNRTTLTGSSSDPSVYINTYRWTKLSGPSGGEVNGYWLKTITLTDLVQGIYNYQLEITDNKGTVSIANVKVTVNSNALRTVSNLNTSVSAKDNKGDTEDSHITVVPVIPLNSNIIDDSKILNIAKVYPNPVADITTLEINIPQQTSEILITVTDMNGSAVFKKKISSAFGLITEQINMSGLAKGTYILTVLINNRDNQTLKIVKL